MSHAGQYNSHITKLYLNPQTLEGEVDKNNQFQHKTIQQAFMRHVSQTPPTAEKALKDSRREEAFDLDDDRSARSCQVHQEGRAIPEEGTECSGHRLRHV